MASDREHTIRIGPQGRIVIPVDLRRQLELDEGAELHARVSDGALVLESPGAVLARLRKQFASTPNEARLSDQLIRDRRAESARELAE